MHLKIEALAAAVTLSLAGAGSAHAQQTTTPPPAPPPPAAAPAPVVPASTAPVQTPTTTTSGIVATDAPPTVDLPAAEKTTSPINRPLMATGVILLGGTYAASAIDAATSGRDSDKNNLYYPIVGPWMDYADRGGCPQTGSCTGETGNKALLILDGVGQGLGAIAIVTSLFIPEKSTRNWYLIGDGALHAAPSRVGSGYGFGAGGVF